METNNEVERLRAICEESQAALARLDPLMSEVRRPTQLNTGLYHHASDNAIARHHSYLMMVACADLTCVLAGASCENGATSTWSSRRESTRRTPSRLTSSGMRE